MLMLPSLIIGVPLAFAAAQMLQSGEFPVSQLPPAPNATVPRLIKFGGVLKSANNPPRAVAVSLDLTLYELQQGGSPLWSETQTVNVDEQGRYSILLGASRPQGLPLDLFTSGKALWLGIRPQTAGSTEQPRVLLVAVPYALKAADADTLGGKPASAFVTVETAPKPGALSTTAAGKSRVIATGPEGNPTEQTAISGAGTAYYIPLFTGAADLGNSVLYQSPAGKIGLGTTTPAYDIDLVRSHNADTAFEVNNQNSGGSARATLRLSADTALFSLIAQSTANGQSVLFQGQNNRNMVFQQMANAPIQFWTNNQERIRISGGGNVGIGTSTPNATLEVNGTARFDQAVMFAQPITSTGQLISTVTSGTPPLQISSNTQVPNLNAELLQGHHAAEFQPAGSYVTSVTAADGSISVGGTASARTVAVGKSARTHSITYMAGCDNCGVLQTTDSQRQFYINVLGPMTIVSVSCFSDTGGPSVNIARENRGPTNLLSSNLTCSSDGTSTNQFNSSVLNLDDQLDFIVASTDGVSQRVTIVIQTTLN
jgi:hypothetical protein